MTPETRDFLARVRSAEDPTAVDEARVLAALDAALAAGGAGAAVAGVTATKSTASAVSTALKLVGALSSISVVSALVVAAVSSSPVKPVEAPPHRPAVSVPLLHSSAPAAQTASSPPSASAPPSAASASSRPSAASASARPSVAPASRPRAASAVVPSSPSLRDELALLAGVQAALERGDGAEALRRLDLHSTSDRQLVAERRAARITALCQLGRVPEAEQLAAVFFRENAQSVQRTAVERSCAGTKTNPER